MKFLENCTYAVSLKFQFTPCRRCAGINVHDDLANISKITKKLHLKKQKLYSKLNTTFKCQ